MRLGGPIFNTSDDPAELAQAHRDFGFTAARCPEVELSDKSRIAAIEKAFKEADVVIAEVLAWRNMIEAEDDVRQKNQQYVCQRLALADEVGARCCVDFAGTFEPGKGYGHHPENLTDETFDMIVELVRKILGEAGVEGGGTGHGGVFVGRFGGSPETSGERGGKPGVQGKMYIFLYQRGDAICELAKRSQRLSSWPNCAEETALWG